MKKNNKKAKIFQLRVFFLLVLLYVFLGSSSTQAAVAAKIGKKSYSSLEKAMKAVKNGQTIKLQKNQKVGILKINRKVKFTLDLNKKKLEGHLILTNVKSISIKNGTIKGSIAAEKTNIILKSGTYKSFWLKNKSSLLMENAKVTEVIDAEKSTVKIKKGTISGKNTGNAFQLTKSTLDIITAKVYGTVKAEEKSTVNISDGSFTNGFCVYENSQITIKKASVKGEINVRNSTVLIKGGTFDNDDNQAFSIFEGKLTIDRATVSGQIDGHTSTIIFKDGTYKATYPVSLYNSSFCMNGGTLVANGIDYSTEKQIAAKAIDCDGICDITINGGLITSTCWGLYHHGGGSVLITGGNFQTDGDCIDCRPTLTISGGTFSAGSYVDHISGHTIAGYALVNLGAANVTGGTFQAKENVYAIWDLGGLSILNTTILAKGNTGEDAIK